MCSSSLTAIHLACQSLLLNESQCAVAAGVNLLLHPNKFALLATGNFTSSDGRCRSFGAGGDGYVPGEGVGAVLLKTLSQAEADGDHIYGVILGSSINHGGKTNGYSVPNPNSQSNLVAVALEKANIESDTISYIEAHGTGTSLGDPIEIRGLVKAFGDQSGRTEPCPIGSVKSNVGHLESAAGIAGLTKVLLQMKNRQIVPSLHSRSLNPNIDFSGTPFVIPQDLQTWQRPIREIDGQESEIPRRACLSSFGAGGANAHLVIEEPKENSHPVVLREHREDLFVLSAKNDSALKQSCQNLANFLETDALSAHPCSIADIAHTLRVAREAMRYRVAIIASTVDEFRSRLIQFIEHGADTHTVFYGALDRNNQGQKSNGSEDASFESHDIASIAKAWVSGTPLEFTELFDAHNCRRCSLPGYVFQTSRFWFDKLVESQPQPSVETAPKKLLLKKLSEPEAAPIPTPGPQQQPIKLEKTTQEKTKQEATISPPQGVSLVADNSLRRNVYREIRTRLAEVLFIQPSEIDEDIQLSDLGLDSILGVELIKGINELYRLI